MDDNKDTFIRCTAVLVGSATIYFYVGATFHALVQAAWELGLNADWLVRVLSPIFEGPFLWLFGKW